MTDRIVVVTGSSGGIGTETVRAFEHCGDRVIGLDIATGADLTSPDTCSELVGSILDEHGRIDVLCNNAGVGAVGTVVDATPEDWSRVFETNVFAVAYLSAAVLPSMRERRSGSIVNTCSVAANIGLTDRAVYSASKGAVRALTMAMAADEIGSGVRINCVSPATVEGPWVARLIDDSDDPVATRASLEARQPMRRLVTAAEVAAVIVHLADNSNATTGFDYRLDAGMTTVHQSGL